MFFPGFCEVFSPSYFPGCIYLVAEGKDPVSVVRFDRGTIDSIVGSSARAPQYISLPNSVISVVVLGGAGDTSIAAVTGGGKGVVVMYVQKTQCNQISNSSHTGLYR